ncbi:AMP-binding protein [Asanoa sp. WMMD1127]|uniref:AMP-binding protein n=1 Tax=Asanoa sp. WMMD1127 TaxID=3016107 RepID=UPI00241702C3|nr:AMP-binding protein [Asanoa sp. WMMD1127]MDG4821959.1 AMP-binding protein [Asanoa sp. WMMD1127]
MSAAHTLFTLGRRGLLTPGSPRRLALQLRALRRWGFGVGGSLLSAAARSPSRVALIDDAGALTYGSLRDQVVGVASRLPVSAGDRVGVLCRNHRGFVLSVAALSLRGADAVLINTGFSAAQIEAVVRDHGLKLVVHDPSFEVSGPALVSTLLSGSVSGSSSAAGPLDASMGAAALPEAGSSSASGPLPDPSSPAVDTAASPEAGSSSASGPLPDPSSPAVGTAASPEAGSSSASGPLASLSDRLGTGSLAPPERPGRTVVLTSGTTGTPKGARRPNPGGLGPLVSILDRIPVRAGARILIPAPLFHTWGYAALQLALGLRASVVLMPRFSPESLVDLATRHACSAVFAVPVMLERLLETKRVLPPCVRVVAVSGSALPGDLATRFMDTNGDVLYNLYGSTEVSWASVATPAELRRTPGTAGRPPRGTRVAILSAAGTPVAPGTVGRIFVGNDMLFEGYAGHASVESHDGMLSTGDLGFVDSAGLLTVSGRADDMVISGGENVFPSAVEDLLSTLPGVREAAVVGVPDAEFGQRLAAFVVTHDGVTLTADEVRDYVRRVGARFAVPRDVRFVTELPRTTTGKVMKRALLND